MAERYLKAGGTGNWNSNTNWAADDIGGADASFPVAGDNVHLTTNSGATNITINVASACASIIAEGSYTGTVTYTNTLTTTSTVTYISGMTLAGTGDHITVTSSTITNNASSGFTGGLRLGGTSQTYTLGSNLVIAGTLLFNHTTALTFAGAFNITAAVHSCTATVGTWTQSGNITITGNSALSSATSTTMNGGFAYQADTCTVSGGQTVTITNAGSVTITGLTSSTTANVFNGGTWNTGGLSVTVGAVTGTTVFNITGGTVTLTTALSNSMTFAGNITWASQTNLYAASGTPTLTYTSGTITVGTSILSTASSFTIAGAMPLFSWIMTAAQTATLNARVTGTGTLTLPNAAVTFAGTDGWTFANVTNSALSATRITTFAAGEEYIITTNLATEATDLVGEKHTWTSSDGTTKAIITLQPGATQDVAWIDPTRIDSRNGQTIFSFRGSITTCFNWSTSIGAGGNLIPTAGGETATLAGVTKNNAGAVLVSCDVELHRYSASGSAYIGRQVSDGTTGAYSFQVFPSTNCDDYYVATWKDGSPNVFDITDRTLSGA